MGRVSVRRVKVVQCRTRLAASATHIRADGSVQRYADVAVEVGSADFASGVREQLERLGPRVAEAVAFADADDCNLRPKRSKRDGRERDRAAMVPYLEDVDIGQGTRTCKRVENLSFGIACEQHR